VDKVNAQKPDLVLIGGDIREGHRGEADIGAIEAQFRRLEARYGVFAVPGNHEGYAGTSGEFFVRSHIRFLQDEVVPIDGLFTLVGRRDARRGTRESAAGLLLKAPDGLPVILLDHRPTDMEAVSRTPVDLQLSGHTHHGQLFPANFVTQLEYGLSWGLRKTGHTHFIVTSGVGLWGPPVRTVGASEIVVIHVRLRDSPEPAPGPGN
ncbi:MAG: metallophosphoesterase, partial [Candidatus Aminicenantes bacterium]|nr:metallophosphoesterase [Candidatus Aminicenantes bacterium]